MKYLWFCFCLFLIKDSIGQFRKYQFEKSYEPYSELVNPVHLQSDTQWLDTSFTSLGYRWEVPASSGFRFGGDTIHTFTFKPYSISGTTHYSMYLELIGTKVDIIIQAGAAIRLQEPNAQPPFISEINFQTDSNNGLHVNKFELKQIGLADSLRSVLGQFNQQIWLYENGTIEFRFGMIQAPEIVYYHKKKIQIRISSINSDSAKTYHMLVIGDTTNPRFHILNADDSFSPYVKNDSSLKDFPGEGVIYTFSNKEFETVGPSLSAIPFSFDSYPNPASDLIRLNLIGLNDVQVSYRLYSIQGELVKEGFIHNHSNAQVAVSDLHNGLYWLLLTSKSGEQHIQSVIIQH